jgi:hypothetical protein
VRSRGSGNYRKSNKCHAISILSSNVFRYSGALQRALYSELFSGLLVFSIAAVLEFKSVLSNERLVDCI